MPTLRRVSARLTIRTDTTANWTSENPVLLDGEIGWESNASKLKVGDGVTAWNQLGYYTSGTDAPGSLVHDGTRWSSAVNSYRLALESNYDKIDTHEADTTNPHSVTAAQVGAYTTAETDAAVSLGISNLIDNAPGALDTLNELAAALGDDANFSTTITNTINTVSTNLASHEADTSNPHSVTAAQAGAPTLSLFNTHVSTFNAHVSMAASVYATQVSLFSEIAGLRALNIDYTLADSNKWLTTQPTEVKGALDELATRVTRLEPDSGQYAQAGAATWEYLSDDSSNPNYDSTAGTLSTAGDGTISRSGGSWRSSTAGWAGAQSSQFVIGNGDGYFSFQVADTGQYAAFQACLVYDNDTNGPPDNLQGEFRLRFANAASTTDVGKKKLFYATNKTGPYGGTEASVGWDFGDEFRIRHDGSSNSIHYEKKVSGAYTPFHTANAITDGNNLYAKVMLGDPSGCQLNNCSLISGGLDDFLDLAALLVARDTVYNPTTTSDWSTTPDDVRDGLDELASRVTVNESAGGGASGATGFFLS